MSITLNATAIMLEGERTCTIPPILHMTFPIIANWTFHNLLSVIAGVTAIITLMVSLANIYRHLSHYTCPQEQRQIVRIILTPLVFSLFNMLALWFYDAAAYLQPIAQLYEAFGLIAVFLLFVAFTCPDPGDYARFYASLGRRRAGVISIFVFQILACRAACATALWILHGVDCPLDSSLRRGLLIIQCIQTVSTVLCVLAILRFYQGSKASLKARHSLSKLVMFKLIVFIQIVQTLLFNELLAKKVLLATKHISYLDWQIGVPAFCTCSIMCLFSFGFLWSFTAAPYVHAVQDLEKSGEKQERLSILTAFLDVVNVWDIVLSAVRLGALLGKAKDAFQGDDGFEEVQVDVKPTLP